MASTPLSPGTKAPPFRLNSDPERQHSLEDYRGKPVILAFYPADWSPVCGDQMSLYNEGLLPTGVSLRTHTADSSRLVRLVTAGTAR